MRRILCVLLCASILIPCTACWDYAEVNMQDYAFGVAIDKQDGEYDVSIETLKISGSPESAGSKGLVVKTRGKNLFDAVRAAITHAGKKLYWGHFRIAVIGESAADDLHGILDVFSRAQDVYLNVALLIARDHSAGDIISAKIPRETMVTDHIMEIFENQTPSRRFIPIEIWQVFRDMSRSSTCIIPTVGLDSEGVPTVEGSAVFNAGQLAGYLSGDETVILSLLKESHGGGYIPSLQISESTNISLEISQNKSSARAKLKDHTPELFITMRTTAALSRASGRCDLLDESTRKLIKTAAEEHLNARIDALIRRIRTENLGDPLFWKHAIQTACPDWWAQNPDLHNSIIKTVPIHRDVRVALNSAGMTKHTLTFE